MADNISMSPELLREMKATIQVDRAARNDPAFGTDPRLCYDCRTVSVDWVREYRSTGGGMGMSLADSGVSRSEVYVCANRHLCRKNKAKRRPHYEGDYHSRQCCRCSTAREPEIHNGRFYCEPCWNSFLANGPLPGLDR